MISRSQDRGCFPTDKDESAVLLVVDDKTITDKSESFPVFGEPFQRFPKKKCPFAKPGKCVLLLAILGYAIYFLGGLYQSYGPTHADLTQLLSTTWGHHHGHCEPNVRYVLNQTFEFSPQEYGSLGVAAFGNAKFSTVSFERHDSEKVVIEPEIYISSVGAADRVHVGARTKDSNYGFWIMGPSWFSGHKDCFSTNIVVKLPKDLEELKHLWVRLPNGHVDTDFEKKLLLQKLHIELGSGNIHVKDKAADHLVLTTGIGSIKVENFVSQKVSLYVRKGDITAFDVRSAHVIGGAADGNVSLTVKEAGLVYAKNFNGASTIKVESLDPEVGLRGYHFAAGTVNGHAQLSLPTSYKGRFSSTTLNGKASVFIEDDSDLHYTKNYYSAKRGYKGETPDSPSYAEAAALNGNTELLFV